MITKSPKGYVESWYDRRTSTWITQLKDLEGNQIGDAEFSARIAGRDFDHKQLVKKLNDLGQ